MKNMMLTTKFKNLLIAEDDDDDFALFAEAISNTGYDSINISRAKNGSECLLLLKNEEHPDLIFLDLNMPLKNGVETLKSIKDNPDLADIPVIIYSTSHYLKDIDTCYKENANFYIIKPDSFKTLEFVLSKAINLLNQSLEKPQKGNFVVAAKAFK